MTSVLALKESQLAAASLLQHDYICVGHQGCLALAVPATASCHDGSSCHDGCPPCPRALTICRLRSCTACPLTAPATCRSPSQHTSCTVAYVMQQGPAAAVDTWEGCLGVLEVPRTCSHRHGSVPASQTTPRDSQAAPCPSHQPARGMHRQLYMQFCKYVQKHALQGACGALTSAFVWSTVALMPKSLSFASPVMLMRMLAGLMSRCTCIPARHQGLFHKQSWQPSSPPDAATSNPAAARPVAELCSSWTQNEPSWPSAHL